MRKIVLTVMVAGSLLATSCKKAKEAGKGALNATENVAGELKNAADKTVEAAQNTVEQAKKAVAGSIAGIEIPSFENEEVNKYVKTYTDYAKDYITAKGDVLKNDLAKRSTELTSKAKDVANLLKGEDATKFSNFMTKLQSKMHDASAASHAGHGH